jgi:hypothetical protein
MPRLMSLLTAAVTIVAMAVIVLLLARCASADNAPPTLEVDEPFSGAILGAEVRIRGVARDAEGFNMLSYVEVGWDELPWNTIPTTPGNRGYQLSFCVTVGLTTFLPGAHSLRVRAYDGANHSAWANISITIRDIPDLVVFPADISLSPSDARAGERITLVVVVRNQGGEDATNVTVRATWEGAALGVVRLRVVPAGGQATARLRCTLLAGTSDINVHVEAGASDEERNLSNNDASATFELEEDPWARAATWLLLGLGALATVAILMGAYARSRRPA